MRHFLSPVVALSLIALPSVAFWAGCFRDNPVPLCSTPHDGSIDSTVPHDMAHFVDLLPPPPCPDGTQLVFVIDLNSKLSRFHPETATFADIGTINCPAANGDTPFSMAVQRDGNAWVLYNSGKLYHVDTRTAECAPTPFKPGPNDPPQFGMGFTADTPGSMAESLWIAGDSIFGDGGVPSLLGTLDVNNFMVKPIGLLAADLNLELSGGDDGQLWGFSPTAATPLVAQIDKQTGMLGKTFPLPQLTGTPEDWAFARWGGDFWIFLKRSAPMDTSTRVYHLRASDGSLETVVQSSGRHILGAGVSLCTANR